MAFIVGGANKQDGEYRKSLFREMRRGVYCGKRTCAVEWKVPIEHPGEMPGKGAKIWKSSAYA